MGGLLKLLLCPKCWDVITLTRSDKKCECGLIHGRYTGNAKARVSAASVVLGFPNQLLFFHDGRDVKFEKPASDEEKVWQTAIKKTKIPRERLEFQEEFENGLYITTLWKKANG